MKKTGFSFITIIIACIVLFFMGRYMVSIRAVPSLSEYMASTTQSEATTTSPAAASADMPAEASSTDALLPSALAITAPKGIIQAAIAADPDTMQKGLGGIMSLPADHGMLFIFPTPGSYGFWMKDMHIPLDMVWISPDKTVQGIARDISPETYPNVFLPPGQIGFVLEINAGAAETFGIATGTALHF